MDEEIKDNIYHHDYITEINISEKYQLTYNDFSKLIDDFILLITSNNNKYDSVHGFIRGGLPIAVHLSHYLNIPLIVDPTKIMITQNINDTLLVVDDIVDNGNTMNYFVSLADFHRINYVTASLYWKPHSTFIPDFYLFETEKWIVFPWEKFDEECVVTENYKEYLSDG